MLEIRQFEPTDILAMNPREPDKSIIASIDNPLETAKEYVKRGPCWTLWNGAVPIACAGMIILWPHVAESWALTSELVSKYPVCFHRAVKWGIEKTMNEHQLYRLQVCIPETHLVSCRWIQALGFEKESTMRNYGPDAGTYFKFVKLWNDRRAAS